MPTLLELAQSARTATIGTRPAVDGDCEVVSEALYDLLTDAGYSASMVSGYYGKMEMRSGGRGLPSHTWVQVGDTYIDATHDQFKKPTIRIGKLSDKGFKKDYKANHMFSYPKKAGEAKYLYHATYLPHLDSIMQYGLGGKVAQKTWEFSNDGVVCLAKDPYVAESYAETSEDVPEDWLCDIIVLAVDKSKLDSELLRNDPNVKGPNGRASSGCYEYAGVIAADAIHPLRRNEGGILAPYSKRAERKTAHIRQDLGWRKDKEPEWQAPEEHFKTVTASNATDTPEFQAWFAGSKCVDPQGDPLRVFHGTFNSFDTFDTNKGTTEGAAFFTPDPEIASTFADAEEHGLDPVEDAVTGNVMPVYLCIKNPLVVTSEEVLSMGTHSFDAMRSVVSRARAEGHDGLHILDVPDGNKRSDQWAAFRPNQIKSAIGNSGKFNRRSPKITASAAPTFLELAQAARAAILGSNPAVDGDCEAVSDKLCDLLNNAGYDARIVSGFYGDRKQGLGHLWVQVGDTYIDATLDQFQQPAIRIGKTSDKDFKKDHTISRVFSPKTAHVRQDLSWLKSYLTMSERDKAEEFARKFPQGFTDWLIQEYPDETEEMDAKGVFYEGYIDDFEEVPDNYLLEFFRDKSSYYINNDPAECPSFMYFSFEGVVKNQWLVHKTDDPDGICASGFTIGMDDLSRLGLTTYYNESGKRGGYNFAFLARDAYLGESHSTGNGSRYGRDAVVFHASGLNLYHNGDEENQVVFWGADARDIIPLYHRSEGWCLPNDSNGKPVFYAERLQTVVDWVEKNFAQYRKTIVKKASGEPLKITASVIEKLAGSGLPSFDEYLRRWGGLSRVVGYLPDSWDWYRTYLAEGQGTNVVEEWDSLNEEQQEELVSKFAYNDLKEAYDEFASVEMNDPMTVYRAVNLKHIGLVHTIDFGTSWSWNEDNAIPHGACMGSGRTHIFRGEVSKHSVDWQDTIRLNMDPHLREECEIRLEPDAEVKITGWRLSKETEWHEPEAHFKTVTASVKSAANDDDARLQHAVPGLKFAPYDWDSKKPPYYDSRNNTIYGADEAGAWTKGHEIGHALTYGEVQPCDWWSAIFNTPGASEELARWDKYGLEFQPKDNRWDDDHGNPRNHDWVELQAHILSDYVNDKLGDFPALQKAIEYVAQQIPEGKLSRYVNYGKPKTASAVEPLPPEPGTAPIPAGTVRLYHYTKSYDNLPSIVQNGLLKSQGRGDGGSYNEPSAGIWASTVAPSNQKLYVEFWATYDQISHNADYPDKNEDLTAWGSTLKHVIMRGDVPPSQFVAIHEPWHFPAYHLLKDWEGTVAKSPYLADPAYAEELMSSRYEEAAGKALAYIQKLKGIRKTSSSPFAANATQFIVAASTVTLDEVKAGKLPGMIYAPERLGAMTVASYRNDHILVNTSFFDDDAFGRTVLLWHEFGHEVAQRAFADNNAAVVEVLRPFRKNPEDGWNYNNPCGVSSRPEEMIADVYSELMMAKSKPWEDEEWRCVPLYKFVLDTAKKLGMPTPSWYSGSAKMALYDEEKAHATHSEIKPGWSSYGEGERLSALPDDTLLWVYHATDKATAQKFLTEGIDPTAKPNNLARMRYEQGDGEYAEFAPGRGLAGGLYVGLTPMGVEGYGREVLAIHCRKSDLKVPPEQSWLGRPNGVHALVCDDAYIDKPIPASDIRVVKRASKTAYTQGDIAKTRDLFKTIVEEQQLKVVSNAQHVRSARLKQPIVLHHATRKSSLADIQKQGLKPLTKEWGEHGKLFLGLEDSCSQYVPGDSTVVLKVTVPAGTRIYDNEFEADELYIKATIAPENIQVPSIKTADLRKEYRLPSRPTLPRDKNVKWLWSEQTGPVLFRWKRGDTSGMNTMHAHAMEDVGLPCYGQKYDESIRGTAELNSIRKVIHITSYIGGEDLDALVRAIRKAYQLSDDWKVEHEYLKGFEWARKEFGKNAAKPKLDLSPYTSQIEDARSRGFEIEFINKLPKKYYGKHFPDRKVIEVFTKGRTSEQIVATLEHEIGHVVDYARRGIVADPMGDSIRNQYTGEIEAMQDHHVYFRGGIKEKEAKAIRVEVPRKDGAASTQKEIYADAYRLYKQSPERLVEIAPTIYREISEFLGGGKKTAARRRLKLPTLEQAMRFSMNAPGDLDEQGEFEGDIEGMRGAYNQVVADISGWQWPKDIYRALSLPSGIEDLDTDKVGVCWAWNESAACVYGGDNRSVYVLKGMVTPEAVDWECTIQFALTYGEQEIRLLPQAKVKLVAYREEDGYGSKGTWVSLNKRVIASVPKFKDWLGKTKTMGQWNARDLSVTNFVNKEGVQPEPFMGKYTIVKGYSKYNKGFGGKGEEVKDGFYTVFDGEKPIASMCPGSLVVDKKYRRQGIGVALAKTFMKDYPGYRPSSVTPRSRKLFERAWNELQGEQGKTASTPEPYTVPKDQYVRDNLNGRSPDKYHNSQFHYSIFDRVAQGREGQVVGTLGDFLNGKNLRALYAPVLNVPIMILNRAVEKGQEVTNKTYFMAGAFGKYQGKPCIFINQKAKDKVNTLLEEGAHALQEYKGRHKDKRELPFANLTETEYESDPQEMSAKKMVDYAQNLDRDTDPDSVGPEYAHAVSVWNAIKNGYPLYEGWEKDYPGLVHYVEDKDKEKDPAKLATAGASSRGWITPRGIWIPVEYTNHGEWLVDHLDEYPALRPKDIVQAEPIEDEEWEGIEDPFVEAVEDRAFKVGWIRVEGSEFEVERLDVKTIARIVAFVKSCPKPKYEYYIDESGKGSIGSYIVPLADLMNGSFAPETKKEYGRGRGFVASAKTASTVSIQQIDVQTKNGFAKGALVSDPDSLRQEFTDHYGVREKDAKSILQDYGKHHVAILRNIEINPDARGGGYGTKLLKSFEKAAKSRGAEVILLMAFPGGEFDAERGIMMPDTFDLNEWYTRHGYEQISDVDGAAIFVKGLGRSKKASVFNLNVPEESLESFLSADPKQEGYWEYHGRPSVLPGEKINFICDGMPIAETVCDRIEKPDEYNGEGTHRRKHKIWWKADKFKKYASGADAAARAKMEAFKKSMEFPLTVYRAIDVDPTKVDMGSVGSYWAVDEKNAMTYFGDYSKEPTILRAKVLEEDIDWEETFYQNIRYGWGETEVYVKPKSGITLTGIQYGNDKWEVPTREQRYVSASHRKTAAKKYGPVYHGTANWRADIKNDKYRTGRFFSSDPDVAKWYGSKVFKAYVTMNNPYIVDAEGNGYFSVPIPKDMRGWLAGAWENGVDTDLIAEFAYKNKYDGVIIKNVVEGNDGACLTADNYIVFQPSQVKVVAEADVIKTSLGGYRYPQIGEWADIQAASKTAGWEDAQGNPLPEDYWEPTLDHPDIMYHQTSDENRESILKHGLLRSEGEAAKMGGYGGIFLDTAIDDTGPDTWQVDVSGLMLERDDTTDISDNPDWDGHEWWVTYEDDIPSLRLKLMTPEGKTSANKTILWLDDVRQPADPNVVWVKNYEEFVQYLQTHEMPWLVSLDCDLHEEHLYDHATTHKHEREMKLPERTIPDGVAAARWIVEQKLPLNKWQVHSANLVGASHMREILSQYCPGGEIHVNVPYDNVEDEVYGGRVRNGYRVDVTTPTPARVRLWAEKLLNNQNPNSPGVKDSVDGWRMETFTLATAEDYWGKFEDCLYEQESGGGVVLENYNHTVFVWVQKPQGK